MAVEYITKQQALEAIRTNSIWQPGSWAFSAIKKALESIPAADVKPVVHGKWIPCGGGKRTCSECGHFAFRVVCNFCPNCGCDMREEQT